MTLWNASGALTLGLTVAVAVASDAQTPQAPGGYRLASAQQPVASRAPLTGTWRKAETSKQRSGRHQAIDQAIESMGWLKRGAARDKLREVTSSADNIEIVDAGDQVTIAAAEKRITSSTDGRSTKLAGLDSEAAVQAVRVKGNLMVKVTGASGTRTTTYAMSPDGRNLTLEIEMAGGKLPKPIRYQVRYTRI